MAHIFGLPHTAATTANTAPKATATTAAAGGPTATAAANDITPTPLGDINNLPVAGAPSSLPLTSTPTGQKLDDAHRTWSSVGDPHITSGGDKFDNQQQGDFVQARTKDGSFEVQARQEKINGTDNFTANTNAAIKDGDNVVSYDVKTKKLTVNGKEWDGATQPPGGTKIERAADGFKVTTAKGDETTIRDKGVYLDLEGKLGPDRTVDDVQGALGKFDNVDDASSHVKRDGTAAATTDEMITDWKVKDGESLFNKQAGGPAAGGPGAAEQPGAAVPANPAAPAAPNGKGGPAPANPAAPAVPAKPAAPADPAAPAPDGKGGPAVDDDMKKALTEILDQLKNIIAQLGKLLEKLGVKPDAPAAGGPAAPANPARPVDPAAPAAPAAGGPAGAPKDAAAPVTKTFAEQKAEDEKKAKEAADAEKAKAKPVEGKGGPAAADAPAAPAKAAEVPAAKAANAAEAADPMADIMNQLKDLLKTLTGLLEKILATQGAAPVAAEVKAA